METRTARHAYRGPRHRAPRRSLASHLPHIPTRMIAGMGVAFYLAATFALTAR